MDVLKNLHAILKMEAKIELHFFFFKFTFVRYTRRLHKSLVRQARLWRKDYKGYIVVIVIRPRSRVTQRAETLATASSAQLPRGKKIY